MAEKRQNFLSGAATLAAGVAVVKLISALYKIPLGNLIGNVGMAHFNVAYALYGLLLTLSTSGLPVALSRLVSAADAQGRGNQVRKIFSSSLLLFLLLGAAGMGVMLFGADWYAAGQGDSMAGLSIRALAPAVLCVCVIAAVRGYTQGLGNMRPTAVSQIIEAVGKLLIGLALTWYLLRRGADLAVASAAAIFGVTVGTVVTVVYLGLWLTRHKRRGRFVDSPDGSRPILKRVLSIGIPVTLGASAMSIITVVDQRVILNQLQNALGYSEEVATALYGEYSFAMNLFNLPSSFMAPLTNSLIPAVSVALVQRNAKRSQAIVDSAFRVVALLALPAGIGLSVLAEPILLLLYPMQAETALAAAPHLQWLGIASFFVCLMLLTNGILQAHGRERIPVYTMILGGLVKVLLNYVLIAQPALGIRGAGISTLCCYLVIALANCICVSRTLGHAPRYLHLFFRPLLASGLMGVSAWSSFALFSRLTDGSRVAVLLAIGFAVAVYAVLVVGLRLITREDLELVPKGAKLAKILRLR